MNKLNTKFIKFLLYIFSILLLFGISSCEKKDPTNPFHQDFEIPSPTDFSITQTSLTSCKLSWTDNVDGEQGYIIARKKDNDYWVSSYQVLNANAKEFIDENLSINSTYKYRVFAYADENISSSQEAELMASFPSPTTFDITPTSITSCELVWSENINGEDGFKIDRKKDTEDWDIEYQVLGENIHKLTESDLIAGSAYRYRIYAYSGEEKSDSLESEVIMSFPAPTNFQINQTNNATCQLSWNYSGFGDEEGFKIKRRNGSNNWLEIAQLDINESSYEDTDLIEAETYEYMIYAYSSLFNGNIIIENVTIITSIELSFNADPNIITPQYSQNALDNYLIFNADEELVDWKAKREHLNQGFYGGYPYWFELNRNVNFSNSEISFEINITEYTSSSYSTAAHFGVIKSPVDTINAGDKQYYACLISIDSDYGETPFICLVAKDDSVSVISDKITGIPTNETIKIEIERTSSTIDLIIYNSNGFELSNVSVNINDLNLFNESRFFYYNSGNGGNSTPAFFKGTFDNLKINDNI